MAIETSVDTTEVQPPVQPNRIFSLEDVNVLLIEDDPLIRESLATLLEGWVPKREGRNTLMLNSLLS